MSFESSNISWGWCLALGATLWALVLAGCTSRAPLAPALDVVPPASWTAAVGESEGATASMAEPATTVAGDGAPSHLDRWWADFGDPTLDGLIVEALEHNRDLAVALAAVDAARARASLAGADRQPQLRATLDGSKRQQVFVGLPIPNQTGPLKSRSSSWSSAVGISWEADLWGRLKAGQRAAVGDLRASEADLAAARLSLSAQVTRSWLALLESEHQLALARQTVESRQRTSHRVELRYRQGLAPSVELRLARSAEAQARSMVERLAGQRAAAGRQLEVLVGRYPAGELVADTTTPGPLPAPPPAIPAGLPAELVARRPDLRASEARLEAAGYRLAEARAAFYPRLTLSGSAGTSGGSVGNLLDGDFSVWSLAGGLLQPIFQGGRLRAAAELAEASREAALARHAQTLLRAFGEVEVALEAEGWLAAEEEALGVAVEESRAAASLAEERYRAGVGEYLSVLESQRQAFASEAALLSVQRQRLSQRVDLYLALGGALPPSTAGQPRIAADLGAEHQLPISSANLTETSSP